METVKASFTWDGSEVDVLTVFVEPTPAQWEADPVDDATLAVLRVVDDQGRETGRVAGVEVVGFLDFDRWDSVPQLPLLWQVQGWEAVPLPDLLRRLQHVLHGREAVAAAV